MASNILTGRWRLRIDGFNFEELSESTLEHIAWCIQEGYTNGQIVENDKKTQRLMEEIEEEWKQLFRDTPKEELIDEIAELIMDRCNYPDFNTTDVKIGIKKYINHKLNKEE